VIGRGTFFALALCLAVWSSSAIAIDDRSGESSGTDRTMERQLLVMLHLPLPHFRAENGYFGRYADDAGHHARRRIAEGIAGKHNLKLVSDWPMPALGLDCFVMEVRAADPVDHIADVLSRDPRVEWAQRMSVYHALAASDPLYPLQPSAKYWHLTEIHAATTGRDVRVAIVDSGVDDNHPDLTGKVALKENFVDGNPYVSELHGTAVAGIIAANAGNGVGIEGVAPNARLMALRACWEMSERDTRCSSFTLGKALNFAIMRKAQVINLSIAGPADRLLQLLLDAALARGVIIVGAVDPQNPRAGFPASHPGVLAVSDEEFKPDHDRIWIAPGRDIPTTAPGGRWSFVSGSSYACAHATGMIALLVELHPSFNSTQITRELIPYSASSNPGRAPGTIDACATIAKSVGSCICSCATGHVSWAMH
jgi:subtilisin family serine protease